MKEFDELNQVKKAMMDEREKAMAEKAEKEEREGKMPEEKDDYLSKITVIASKIEHNMGVYLQAAYIDAGQILDHRLNDIYISYINSINHFLRLFEKIEGETKEEALKEAIVKLRFVFLETADNLIRPILKRFEESKEYPTKNIDTLKSEWNAHITEFNGVAEKFYDALDLKRLFI